MPISDHCHFLVRRGMVCNQEEEEDWREGCDDSNKCGRRSSHACPIVCEMETRSTVVAPCVHFEYSLRADHLVVISSACMMWKFLYLVESLIEPSTTDMTIPSVMDSR